MSETPWTTAPILGVSDVNAAAHYWCDVLGFELSGPIFAGVGEPEAGGVYAIVQRNGCEVHLQIRRLTPPDPARARERSETDIYLRVDDLPAVYDDLLQRGAEVWGPPKRAPYGILEIRVTDPNGYRLTFGEREA